MSIEHLKGSMAEKVNVMLSEINSVNDPPPPGMQQTGQAKLESDCPYIFGMGCKLKNVVDNLNSKLDELNKKIDNSNAQIQYSTTTKEVKNSIKDEDTFKNQKEFRNYALQYSKDSGKLATSSDSSTLDYILYACFFCIVAFSAYVLFSKSE